MRSAGLHLSLEDADGFTQQHLELPLENIADLHVALACRITGPQHRVVVRVNGGDAADHPVDELLG
ncbi:Uncharacterised protein [Mycobacterium tuberculosis]|nr:Uncharacterised protein [Mycobacterium tuberculosis]